VPKPIHPILLAGGSGSRLWPLSRKSYPKQFAPLSGKETLFQASAKRVVGDEFAPPLVLTHADFRFIVTEQLQEAGIDPGSMLLEPLGRNTAPAILAAALWLQKDDPNALMLVAPSDHVIPDVAAFQDAVALGRCAAEEGKIVTFGITPTHPEIGYGYLELSDEVSAEHPKAIDLLRFVEKPDIARAEEMSTSGRHLWNAGIFLFSAKTLVEAFKEYAANLVAPVTAAIDSGKPDLVFFRLDRQAWSDVPDISFDYAIMERTQNLAVVPFGGGVV